MPGSRRTARPWTSPWTAHPTTSRRSAATSRSCRARSTASRWSIWTTAPRRRSRPPSSKRSTMPTATNMPTSIAGCTSCPTRRRTLTRRPARRSGASSTRRSTEEIVFTSNTTSAINTVAYGYGMPQDRRGRRDRALHHGAPFQHRAVALHPRASGSQAGLGAGRRFRRAALKALEKRLTPRTKLWPSPRCRMRWAPSRRSRRSWRIAHARGIPVLVDGSQSAVHMPVDVQDIGLRLLRLHRPQGLRAVRHRRALRQARTCSTRCGRSRAAAR